MNKEPRPKLRERVPRSVKGLGGLTLVAAAMTVPFMGERVNSDRVNGHRQELIQNGQDLQRRIEVTNVTGVDPDPKAHELAKSLGLEQSPDQKQP